MLSPCLCPDLRWPSVARSQTCTLHCQEIGVQYCERGQGAWRQMHSLVTAPQPAEGGLDVRRANQAKRHRQLSAPCILTRWPEQVEDQCQQVRGESGYQDRGRGVWFHLGGTFPRCPPITLLGRLNHWAPCGSLLGGAQSRLFPIIVQQKPQLLLICLEFLSFSTPSAAVAALWDLAIIRL
jgi:hypothetical protein